MNPAFHPFKFSSGLEDEMKKLLQHTATTPENEEFCTKNQKDGSSIGQHVLLNLTSYSLQDTMFRREDSVIPFHMNGIDSEFLPDVDNIQSFVRRREKKKKAQTECVFCKNNNEPPKVYRGHVLKDIMGRTTCPILRRYTCPICLTPGGDLAHTIKYCPNNRTVGTFPSCSATLRTPRTSTGIRRVRQDSLQL